MNYLPRCFMTAKRPNSYFEELVKMIGLPSKNDISVIKLHLSLLSTTQSKENCYNCFRRLQKVLIYPHNPMKKTLKSQVCVKAFKLNMFLYVFCLLNHKDNSDIWGSLVWLPYHLATRPDFLLKWIPTHVLLFSKMTLINCTAWIFSYRILCCLQGCVRFSQWWRQMDWLWQEAVWAVVPLQVCRCDTNSSKEMVLSRLPIRNKKHCIPVINMTYFIFSDSVGMTSVY